MNTRAITIAATGIAAIGVLVVFSSSAAFSKEPPPEELSIVLGAPLSDDNIPDRIAAPPSTTQTTPGTPPHSPHES